MGPLTEYVADTMALVRFLEDDLPPKADRVFEEAEQGRNQVILPQIALAEFVYLSLKGRIRGPGPEFTLRETIQNLLSAGHLTVAAMSPAGWEVFLDLSIREMHDRMIAAEAISRGAPLVSNDPAFDGIHGLRVIW